MSDTFSQTANWLAGMTSRSLGWRPGDFWSATPAEIAAIFSKEGETADATLSRSEFESLMERERNG